MLLLPGVHAQERAQPWKAPHFSLDPRALYEAASSVELPENANAAVLEDDETYSFDEQGRCVHTFYVVYKVLNQNGAEGWDSVSVDWEPWHQARPEIKARVIAQDMTVHMLDPKQITEAPAREGEYKTYSDGKTLRAPFPAIAPGVVVEEEFVITETTPFFGPGHVARIFLGREGVPVAHSLAQVEAPLSLPLHTNTVKLDDVKPQRLEANGRVTITWEKGYMAALEPNEPNLPAEYTRYPLVEFATGASWQTMAAEYSKIVDAHADQAAVRELVEKLTAGKTTAAEKEAALLNYLDREIRYTGIEFDQAAIVPHDPTEVMAHKYGDCKDKATMMVAMLRAAGIPAYVALLNAGSRMDVPQTLPGMGLFDHAIVYVPGKPDLWIDATDPWARLGQLPIGDQGRSALIARPETTELVKTPDSASKDNVLLEDRTITLAENGPATVVEVSRPQGVFEGEYRDYYADAPNKNTREGLQRYVKSQYISENLTKVDRSDPVDLAKPFELTLACDKARRGFTDLDNASAAIRVESLFQRLPDDLQRKDDFEEKKKQDKTKEPRAVDWQLRQAFTAEWRYRIVPPLGFVPKPLPANQKITLGPALLTEEFSTDKEGAVLAHLVFDSVKRRYTVAEATELRNKVAEITAGPAVFVNFEPEAQVLLREGKVKEALASYRSLVNAHPKEAVHHLQVAKVLLEGGMGEAARAEARQAVKLEPDSALAEKTLAQILKFDLVGRSMRDGSDLTGAVEAYRAAVKLDADDKGTQADLAILLEYDAMGRRYTNQSHMKEAIAEYKKLGQDKLVEFGLPNNLAFALFYGGEPAEALKAARALNPQPRALIAACVAMLQGSKAGLAEANKMASDENAYKESARTAGEMLMQLRQYAMAADFMEAGAAGDNAAQTMGLARMLRGAQRHEDLKLANTPEDVAKRAFLQTVDPNSTEEKLLSIYSRNAIAVVHNQDPKDLKNWLEEGRNTERQLARGGSSLDVTVDIVIQAFETSMEGNDATGYRVRYQIPGRGKGTFYVVKENGVYKILDTGNSPNSIALEVVDRIKSGDLAGAKALLDWLREDMHLEGGDDPLGGPVFPRFWIKGQAADAGKMTLAAAAIMVGTKPTAAQGIALLEEALPKADTERNKTNIELALSAGYNMLDRYGDLYRVSSDLLKQTPESRYAFRVAVWALIGLRRFDDAVALSNDRLKLLDNDQDAQEMRMRIEVGRDDFAAARSAAQKLVGQGKQDAELLNSIAWFALFTGKVGPEDVEAAIKATEMSNQNPHIMHTLACLDAESGKSKDARDLLLRSMDALNLKEPNDDYWYAFGRIAEQYGEREIAIADYRKLERPKVDAQIPSSSYELAQMRLKALGAASEAAH